MLCSHFVGQQIRVQGDDVALALKSWLSKIRLNHEINKIINTIDHPFVRSNSSNGEKSF
jgi:hypothetical protein